MGKLAPRHVSLSLHDVIDEALLLLRDELQSKQTIKRA
jgi:hypothetical protein